MAGNEQSPVIEDKHASEEEVKLNFRSVFTFFSSLDYLRFLELEGAFEDIESKELYYVGERAAVVTFVIKKIIPSLTLIYWIFFFILSFFYRFNPVVVALVLISVYTFLGFLLVERYTIGRGYLYLVFRDFLINTLIFTFAAWILTDIFVFYLLPRLWEAFLGWYTNVKGEMSYMVAKAVYSVLNPVFNRAAEVIFPYIYVYLYTSPVKVFSLAGVYFFFLFLSRQRRSRLQYKFNRFRKLS